MTGGDGLNLKGALSSRRVTAVDHVRETLRAAILRGDLVGDTRLVQTEIAQELQVSTTPVREAMRDLASEGLITLDNHRIGTVRRPDWDEMSEIIEIRRAIERLALSRAMENITNDDLKRAKEHADGLAAENDVGNWVQRNIEFHAIFHNATGVTRLANFLKTLESAGGVFVAQAQRLQPELRKRAISDHYALLEAFDALDLDRAHRIQADHVNLPLGGSRRTS